MATRLSILEAFADLGDKHFFKIKDGRECLGWIDEVRESSLVFLPAPSPFEESTRTEEEDFFYTIEVDLELIEMATLAYYDREKRDWVPFPPRADLE